jgi:hypothetical protein
VDPRERNGSGVQGADGWRRFIDVADRIAPRFAEHTAAIPALVDSSILLSDGLCVCALCEMFEVDHLLEAGTGFGGSTEMFARYFAGAGLAARIWSIDQAVNPRWQRLLAILGLRHYSRFVWSSEKRAAPIAAARLAPHGNVTLARGDAMVEMPKVAARLVAGGARLGVFIDGPKGEEQMRLAERLFAISPQVRFAALDDIGPIFDRDGRQARFRASRFAAFATSDAAYFSRYSWINRGLVPERMVGEPGHTGYGVGVLINR